MIGYQDKINQILRGAETIKNMIMTYEELLEENKRLKELVDRQTDALAKNCAKLILEAERYIEEHTKKEEDVADWWKK